MRCVWISLVAVLSANAFAASPVTISVSGPAGAAISADFSGLSYESSQVLPNGQGNYTFWPGNLTLQEVFKSLGIRCLRVGGNTADRIGDQTIPADVDRLFGFARAANVDVIYSLQLKNSTAAANVAMADYIFSKYRANLKCFTVGNETNYYMKQDVFEKDVKEYIAAITAKDPDAVFCGADAGHKMEVWAAHFADTFKGNRNVSLITHHAYQGGPKETGAEGQDFLLSPDRLAGYQDSYNTWASVAVKDGFPFRITETNSFNGGGAKGSSDSFASALWVLDYMHWWASHGGDGVNFHTPSSAYAVIVQSGDGYTVRPIGYGIKTFDLGGHGRIESVKLDNPGKVNLTAYAVLADDQSMEVTIINKDHGKAANDADVTIETGPGFSGTEAIYLAAPKGDVGANEGIMLGGATIGNDGKWSGTWEKVGAVENGRVKVRVPAASAAVVRIR